MTTLVNDMGISQGEAAERMEWQLQADPIATALRETIGEELYAGRWMNRDTGRIQVAATVTETSSPSLAEVAELANTIAAECGVPGVDLHMAEYSETELQAAYDWLEQQIHAHPEANLSASLSTPDNRVEILAGAEQQRTLATQELLTAAIKRYGNLIVLTEEEPPKVAFD